MARKKKASNSTVRVNFKGIETRKTPPEGDYVLRVLEVASEKSQSGNDQLIFTLEIDRGEYKGTKLWFYCPLQENSLWKLHAFLTALGVDAPEDEMDIDLSELVDLEVVGVLTHETYQGKKRAKMTDFDSIENYAGEDDEDEKPKKGKKSKKAADEDEDEDEDEKPAKKSKGKKSKSDEDEDEDEKPAKKAKGKKKPAKLDRSDVEDMDEDELQELIDEHDLDVDLDDYKKLPKKVAAVLEALEEEDLLEDDD